MGKTGINTGRDTKTGRFQPGNKASIKHGCWSLTATGKIPSIRGLRQIRQDLERIRLELERGTPSLTLQKKLLIGQVVRTEGQLRMIELYFKRSGLMRPDKWRRGVLEPHPIMATYQSFLNSQRNALMSLGLEPAETEKILTPFEIVAGDKQERASS